MKTITARIKCPWNPKDFDKKNLKIGMKIESEHTTDKVVQGCITMAHMSEPGGDQYYPELIQVERKLDKLAEKRRKKAKK